MVCPQHMIKLQFAAGAGEVLPSPCLPLSLLLPSLPSPPSCPLPVSLSFQLGLHPQKIDLVTLPSSWHIFNAGSCNNPSFDSLIPFYNSNNNRSLAPFSHLISLQCQEIIAVRSIADQLSHIGAQVDQLAVPQPLL